MFSEFLGILGFSLSVTGPIFVILGLGAWLRRIGTINDAFIEVGSRLVFNVTLPALLFISVSKTHLDATANFADCLIGAQNRRMGCTATVTFDAKAAKLPGFVTA